MFYPSDHEFPDVETWYPFQVHRSFVCVWECFTIFSMEALYIHCQCKNLPMGSVCHFPRPQSTQFSLHCSLFCPSSISSTGCTAGCLPLFSPVLWNGLPPDSCVEHTGTTFRFLIICDCISGVFPGHPVENSALPGCALSLFFVQFYSHGTFLLISSFSKCMFFIHN